MKKKGLKYQAVFITDVDVLNDLKAQEEEPEIEKLKMRVWERENEERKRGT